MQDRHNAAAIKELERRLADLKARLPAHSIPPTMMLQLDELEEQLARLRDEKEREEGTP